MLYYLKHEINKFNSSLEIDLKNAEENSIFSISPELNEMKVTPNCVGPFKLRNDQLLVDLLHSSVLSTSLVISNQVSDEFKKLNLPNHRYVDVFFTHKKLLFTNYKALHFDPSNIYLNLIDWNKSRFYKTKDWHEILFEEYTFTGWEEMKSFENKFRNEKANSQFGFLYKLKINYDQPYDLINFGLHGFPTGFVCTDKLKMMVEYYGFTGFDFEPIGSEYFA